MNHISTDLKRNFDKILLGRLKLKLLKRITGVEGCFPEKEQVRHFISEQHRSNALAAALFSTILNLGYCHLVDFTKLNETLTIEQLFSKLEQQAFEEPVFLEIINCPEGLPSTVGALVTWESLVSGGYLYTLALVDEAEFPDSLAGYFKVQANASQPMLSMLTDEGYKDYDFESYHESPLIEFIVLILNRLAQRKPKVQYIPATEVDKEALADANTSLEPPHDEMCLDLIILALTNRIPCTQAIMPLSLIHPYDLDFCLSYPLEVINTLAYEIQQGRELKLLIYWDRANFVMSDDYSTYLAYRRLEYEEVPVTIMGQFPKERVRIVKVGGPELLPSISTASFIVDLPSFSAEDIKNQLLDKRLRPDSTPDVISKLYEFYLGLSMLVQNDRTKERELHEFILNHPIALDPIGLHIQSEVKLGNEYRVDLVIQYDFTSRRILLVELERANLSIFTKSGRPRAKVTHAQQQVEDWLRWWRENPGKVPHPLDSSLPVEGLVVIGRSINMSEDDKKRLLHLNHNRRVKVITYDDLLNQIESLIRNLEHTLKQ